MASNVWVTVKDEKKKNKTKSTTTNVDSVKQQNDSTLNVGLAKVHVLQITEPTEMAPPVKHQGTNRNQVLQSNQPLSENKEKPILVGRKYKSHLIPILTDNRVDPPPGVCFNCWKSEHTRSECLEPFEENICFNCGRRNVVAENCPRCKKAHKLYVQYERRQQEQEGRGQAVQVAARKLQNLGKLQVPLQYNLLPREGLTTNGQIRAKSLPPGICDLVRKLENPSLEQAEPTKKKKKKKKKKKRKKSLAIEKLFQDEEYFMTDEEIDVEDDKLKEMLQYYLRI